MGLAYPSSAAFDVSAEVQEKGDEHLFFLDGQANCLKARRGMAILTTAPMM